MMKDLNAVVRKLKEKPVVESILQFGSSLERKDYRDIDLCIFTRRQLSLKEKLILLRNIPEKYDVSFYEDLSLHIQREVLVEGKVLFTKNYYRLLQQIQYIDLEYPRYKAFLEDYHQERMAAI